MIRRKSALAGAVELSLHFPDAKRVAVEFDGHETEASRFVNPLSDGEREELRWYLESYGTGSLGDPDDREALRIANRLPALGRALFCAVFRSEKARSLYQHFHVARNVRKTLSVVTDDPEVLAVPWELLHHPAHDGEFLFLNSPPIDIRRRARKGVGDNGQSGPQKKLGLRAKERLHLLLIVSRPNDAPFFDSRAESVAVLNAVESCVPTRITWEFLRPASLDALQKRLTAHELPRVDVIHFDGHGVFDRDGGLPERLSQATADSPADTGYLLFENPFGRSHHVSGKMFGRELTQHGVEFVVLSACETAAASNRISADLSTGSVASALVRAGVPAVVGMTHRVLGSTMQTLFGHVYADLARGRSVAESVGEARRVLHARARGNDATRSRGGRPTLRDWLVPALYQRDADAVLLRPPGLLRTLAARARRPQAHLPASRNFFGRRRELFDIERWFANETSRITITGFGGQGKTALAAEARDWLLRVGLFEASVFIDFSTGNLSDAVEVAIAEIGKVFGRSFSDGGEVRAVLRRTTTLLVFDNVETLRGRCLELLLDAVVSWSLIGSTRVLMTSRRPDFQHPDYPVNGSLIHRSLPLNGLGSRWDPDDALEWFANLYRPSTVSGVPSPQRDALIRLFERVGFHPLSIRVLAQQLEARPVEEVENRLDELLADPQFMAAAGMAAGTPAGLVASITLALDCLDVDSLDALVCLGVFEGGAFEDNLVAVTGIDPSQTHEWIEHLSRSAGRTRASSNRPCRGEGGWTALRRQLEEVALIVPEPLPHVGKPFLRFHPALAPLLRGRLSVVERSGLETAHSVPELERQIRALQREVADLREQRTILKKAVAIFSEAPR